MLNLLQTEQDFVLPGTTGFTQFEVHEHDEADMLLHLEEATGIPPVLPQTTDIVPYVPRGYGADDKGAVVLADQVQNNQPLYFSLTPEERAYVVRHFNETELRNGS